MLTIYRKDGTTQIVRVHPQFYHTVVYGNGKNKQILTAEEKARQISMDFAGTQYSAHKLTKQEEL